MLRPAELVSLLIDTAGAISRVDFNNASNRQAYMKLERTITENLPMQVKKFMVRNIDKTPFDDEQVKIQGDMYSIQELVGSLQQGGSVKQMQKGGTPDNELVQEEDLRLDRLLGFPKTLDEQFRTRTTPYHIKRAINPKIEEEQSQPTYQDHIDHKAARMHFAEEAILNNDYELMTPKEALEDIAEGIYVANPSKYYSIDNPREITIEDVKRINLDLIRKNTQKDYKYFSKRGQQNGGPVKQNSMGVLQMQSGGITEEELAQQQPIPGEVVVPPEQQQPREANGATPDTVATQLREGDYVLNSLVKVTEGVGDLKKTIETALNDAKQDGVDLGNREGEVVDVIVGDDEVIIPKELVKYVGLDKLEKMNNRGKQLMKAVQAATEQKQQEQGQ